MQISNKLNKVISGGQTGVDRSALDFFMDQNFPVGGWCPKGRIAEDGILSTKYNLKETKTENYEERTLKNIIDSDATLIIFNKEIDKGTRLTKEFANKWSKPIFEIYIENEMKLIDLNHWINNKKIKILNIAGPRESSSPGIYQATYGLLEKLLL